MDSSLYTTVSRKRRVLKDGTIVGSDGSENGEDIEMINPLIDSTSKGTLAE